MSAFYMYWIVKLDDFVFASIIIVIMSFMALCIALAVYGEHYDYDNPESKITTRWSKIIIKTSLLVLIISSTVAIFLPTTKQACAIIVMPKAVSAVKGNDKLIELPSTIVDIGYKWIQKVSKDLDSTNIK